MRDDYPFIVAHGKHIGKTQQDTDQLLDRAKSDNAPVDAYDFDANRGGWQTMQELRKTSPDLVQRFEREQGVTVDELLTEGVAG